MAILTTLKLKATLVNVALRRLVLSLHSVTVGAALRREDGHAFPGRLPPWLVVRQLQRRLLWLGCVNNCSNSPNMTSRDYTKEVGIPSQKKTLPRPVAYVVLAILAVGVSFGVAGIVAKSKEHHAAEKAASSPAPAMAPASPVAEAPAAR